MGGGESTDFHTKKVFILYKKNSCNFYICIFAFIGQSAFMRYFRDFQMTMLDLPRKTSRIKTQNNLRNLFSPRLFKKYFLTD